MWGAPILLPGSLCCGCAKVRELSELRFGVMCSIGQGIGVLEGGPHRAGKGRFEGFCI